LLTWAEIRLSHSPWWSSLPLSAYPEYPVAEEDSVGAKRRCARTSIRFHPLYGETIIRIGS